MSTVPNLPKNLLPDRSRKRIGIIGGIGPSSPIDFDARIMGRKSPHKVADDLQREIDLPIISALDSAALHAK